MNKKEHWENIYNTKELTDVSWYQKVPVVAIQYLEELKISKNARIVDVGGGDSFFVDYLIENGYEDISVLDISEKALDRAKERLGVDADKVNWIVADASNFRTDHSYDFWYDRAAFHFLTVEKDIVSYVNNLHHNISENGQVVIGTFSEKGPAKCSGIEIQQYSAQALEERLLKYFVCLSCQRLDHSTPFGTMQNFTFCSFKRK